MKQRRLDVQRILLAIICAIFIQSAAVVAMAAEVPFSPQSSSPDYKVVMVKRGSGPIGEDSRIVTHHGNWTRIDSIQSGHASRAFQHSEKQLLITISPDGENPTFMSIEKGSAYDKSRFSVSSITKTETREQHAGEGCDVYRIDFKSPDRSNTHVTKWSCVTDDGIEIANGWGSGGGMELVSLERRPVSWQEVEPPLSLFDLPIWLKPITSANNSAATAPELNYEAVGIRGDVTERSSLASMALSRDSEEWRAAIQIVQPK